MQSTNEIIRPTGASVVGANYVYSLQRKKERRVNDHLGLKTINHKPTHLYSTYTYCNAIHIYAIGDEVRLQKYIDSVSETIKAVVTDPKVVNGVMLWV